MPAPRKVDQNKIIELANSGMKASEISRILGISKPSAIENLKKLGYERVEHGKWKLMEVPTMKGLKEKEKEYVRGRAEGLSQADAALKANMATTKASAASIGTRLEKREAINTPIQDMLYAAGIGRLDRANKLGELLHHQDANIALKAISESNKMDGVYEQKVTIKVQDQAEIQRAFIETLDRLKELGLLNTDNIIDCSFDTVSGEVKAIEGSVEEPEDDEDDEQEEE